MHGEDRSSQGRELAGGGREDWPHVVVAPCPVLLDAPVALLVAVVDGRRSATLEQDDDGVRHECCVGELARDAGDVVVADEGKRCVGA
ncbi:MULTISPECIES: hypothetical protein [unclassified Arthrobacter]|uniref:hypothetical protein n=1 Tax=unclassified Pseudarthrobacter TaxID=2647000 RepID=UPI0033990EF7